VQLVLALFPLHKAFGLKRVVVCTYQSASGAGSSALLELKEHTKRHLQDHPLPPSAYFAHPLAFNCIPQIGRFDDSGYTSEEQKLMNETKKILDHSNLLISATAVRVPTQFCHAESVMLECENDFSQQDLINALEDQPGVCLSPKIEDYPVPLNAANQNAVFIGRVRKDLQIKKTAHLWIVSDNLIKGAALNALQIGERLLPFFPH
jgi:aspartate-semialdehyde dehydrogenase